MLQKIRDHLTGWVAGFIFFVIAVAFVLWGIDIGGANRNFIAKVNGDEVSISQFRRQYQNRLNRLQQAYQDQVPDQLRAMTESQLLEQFIEREVIRQQAQNRGYRVGNDALRKELQSRPEFQVEGSFSYDRYQAQLISNSLTSTGYEAAFRGELQTTQLMGGVSATAFVTPSELLQAYRLQNETREVGYLLVPANTYKETISVEESAIQEYYDSHLDEFVSQETVDLDFVQLRLEDYVEDVDVTEEDVLALYSEDQYKTPEQRDSRHILVSNADRSDEDALKLADELLDRINAGEDFGDIAKEYSDDSGSGAEGGNLGWAEGKVYVGAFRDALFGMDVDETRGAVKSEFGYHIIQLLGVRGGGTKSFESVRAELEQQAREGLAADRITDLRDEVRDRSYESDNLDSVAEEFDLELKQLDGVGRSGAAGIGADRNVIDAAFSTAVLLDNENSDLIDLEDGSVVVLRVRQHNEVETQPLDIVRDQVTEILLQRAAADQATTVAQGLLERLKTGETWESVTEGTELTFTPPVAITRQQAGVPGAVASAAFKMTKSAEGKTQYDGSPLANGDYAIFSVSNTIPGDFANLASEERDGQKAQSVQRIGMSTLR